MRKTIDEVKRQIEADKRILKSLCKEVESAEQNVIKAETNRDVFYIELIKKYNEELVEEWINE